MQGFNALWMPGTDHAGIATQAVVERRLLAGRKTYAARPGPRDTRRANLGLEERIRNAASSASSSGWAAAAIGSAPRFTLDADLCARAVRHTFFRMFEDGLIYRGQRLVNWDTFLQTAVSDDEVFHETVAGPLLAFPLSGHRSRSPASRRM